MMIIEQILKKTKPLLLQTQAFLCTSVIWSHGLDENVQEKSELDRTLGGGEKQWARFAEENG